MTATAQSHLPPDTLPAEVLTWPRTPSYAHYISTMLGGRGFPPNQQPSNSDLEAVRALAAVPSFLQWADSHLSQMQPGEQHQEIKERTLNYLARRGSSDLAIGIAVQQAQDSDSRLDTIHFGLLPRSTNWEGVSPVWPLVRATWTILHQHPERPDRVISVAAAPESTLSQETKNTALREYRPPKGEAQTLAELAAWHGAARTIWIPACNAIPPGH